MSTHTNEEVDKLIDQVEASVPEETEAETVHRILTCDESELNEGEYVEMDGVVVKGKKPKSKVWIVIKKILKKILKGFWWVIKKILKGIWWVIKSILLIIPRLLGLAK